MKKNPLAVRPVSLGRVVATPTILDMIPGKELTDALERHKRRDWGEVSKADWEANDQALKTGARLLSSYKSSNGTKFWIVTEADRSYTTILLPSEY